MDNLRVCLLYFEDGGAIVQEVVKSFLDFKDRGLIAQEEVKSSLEAEENEKKVMILYLCK